MVILLLVYMIIKHGTKRKMIFKDILNEHGSENKLKHIPSILARKNAPRQTDN